VPVALKHDSYGDIVCALHSIDPYGQGPPHVERALYLVLRDSKLVALDPLDTLRTALEKHAPFLSDAKLLAVGSHCLAKVPPAAKQRFFTVLNAMPASAGTCVRSRAAIGTAATLCRLQ
jgi:hypothetical protein